MTRGIFQNFWSWYERNYALNIGVAAGLFLLQIAHLIWLALAVIIPRIFDVPGLELSPWAEAIIVLVDYTEIPALISVSLVYINELRKVPPDKGARGFFKPLFYLLLLNSQWLHLLWITDEFVVARFSNEASGVLLPVWLAWLAILIDYLEVPVMIDTIKKFLQATRKNDISTGLAKTFQSE